MMKYDILITEIPERGGANVVVCGRQFILAWEKDPLNIVGAAKENKMKREVTINALKARVFVELIKEKEEIPNGTETDQKVIHNPKVIEIWKELQKNVQFNIKGN